MAFFSGAKFRQIPRSHLVAMASSPRAPAHRWSKASSSAIFPGIQRFWRSWITWIVAKIASVPMNNCYIYSSGKPRNLKKNLKHLKRNEFQQWLCHIKLFDHGASACRNTRNWRWSFPHSQGTMPKGELQATRPEIRPSKRKIESRPGFVHLHIITFLVSSP